MIHSRPDLEKSVRSLRQALQAAFGPDTSLPVAGYRSASAGHCAAVAVIVHRKLGGNLVSAKVDNESHWFNRIPVRGKWFDIDLTGDQFGRPPIQIVLADTLYPRTKLRDPKELNEETLERSSVLAQRAGLYTGRRIDTMRGSHEATGERKRTNPRSVREQSARAA